MFVSYRGSIFGLIGWQWRYLLFFALTSVGIVLLAKHAPAPLNEHLHLPGLPLGVVGGAIGIFVSFRTNSAYDRWWEGRRLWGALVNCSRHFASQVLAYTDQANSAAPDAAPSDEATASAAPSGEPSPNAPAQPPSALQRQLIERHIGYVHLLRTQLRRQPFAEDGDVRRFVPEAELLALRSSTNPTSALLHLQLSALARALREGRLQPLQHQLLDQTLRELLDVQGGCERIKNTPFPRMYGFIAERLILAFSLLLPLGMVNELGWKTVPMSLLVCAGFLLISEVGRVLEDPFTLFWPALPLSALSTTIELNLRERLGETDLPPLPAPNKKGILM